MKALLIDPFSKTVTEVDTDGTLTHIYALLDCNYVESVRPADAHGNERADGDILLLDEEGKCRNGQAFFLCAFWLFDSLAGRALWIGSDGEEFGDASASRDYVLDSISWLTPL